MHAYDVYGIGNALVDLELEVPDAFLTRLGIQKGSMTLVDEARQREILEQAPTGQHKRSCGGSAANTIIGVAQFGGKAYHSCKVAADPMGDFFAQAMVECGVETNLHGQRETGTTGRCIVLITPDGERSMCTHLGISADVAPRDVVESALKQARYAYVEGYLVSSPSGLEAAMTTLELARQHGVQRAFTFSDAAMVRFFRAGIDRIVASGLDLIFCNEAEALAYADTPDLEAAKTILRDQAPLCCITLGGRGALILQGAREIEVVAPPAQVVDTNGAGDLFAGAFLYGLTHGMPLGSSGRLACAASSVLVGQFGARLQATQAQQILARVAG